MTDAFGELIFRANDGTHGAEPWASDGTAAGTVMIDVNLGPAASYPVGPALADGRVFFRADDGTHGNELWLYESVSGEMKLVKDVDPGAGSGAQWGIMIATGDTVYFGADDGTGLKLWKSDGTAAGTQPVSDDVFVTLDPLLAADGKLFFAGLTVGAGTELWVSDGSDVGTKMVEDISPGPDGSLPGDMVDVDGTVLFAADDGTHGRELWRTDGTAAGTELVVDINPGPLASMVPGAPDFTVVGDTAYFAAGDNAHGRELWRTDGTPQGTESEDIRPGPQSSFPASLEAVDGRIFFAANDGVNGDELWRTDDGGMDADMVADIVPGAGGSSPSDFTQVGNDLFFVARTAAAGRELWRLQLDALPELDDPPVAVDDSATVAEDAPATAVDVLANDTDVDGGPKSIASVTQPAHGEVAIAGGGSGLTYRPDPDYCNDGTPTDDFTYALAPGGDTATVRMTVTCVDDSPPPGGGDVPPPDGGGGGGGPPPAPPIGGTAVVDRAATVERGVARLRLSCRGKGACKGRLTLTVTRRAGKRTVRVVLGTKRFAIAAGKAKTLRIRLNRAGRSRLARSRSGRLRVKLAGAGVKPRTMVLTRR